MSKPTRTILLLTLSLLVLIVTKPTVAEDRHIHVNGEHLSLEDINSLDYLADTVVSDAYYWINFENGAWGYEGSDQTQGYLDLKRLQNKQNAQKENTQNAPTANMSPIVGAWMRRTNASNGIYIENSSKWVFSANGNVAWGSGSIIAGGTAGVSLRGSGNNPPDYGKWTINGDSLHIDWNDGTAGNWAYEIVRYDGKQVLALTTAGYKPYFYKKID